MNRIEWNVQMRNACSFLYLDVGIRYKFFSKEINGWGSTSGEKPINYTIQNLFSFFFITVLMFLVIGSVLWVKLSQVISWHKIDYFFQFCCERISSGLVILLYIPQAKYSTDSQKYDVSINFTLYIFRTL